MKIDLHTHSSASDGTQLPGEVIRSAAEAGLDVVALTDHDTTAGWEEAAEAAREHAVAFVPGTEVSCQTDDGISVHLLSYLQDPQDRALDEVMQRARRSRRTRAERMVELIAEDYPISWEQVLDQVVGDATVGRPHLADALVAAGIAQTRSEAFSTVLHPRSGYYVGHYAPDPVTAVRLVRQAGGVPVMAHPLAGVRGRTVGQEVAHRDNPPEARAVLSQMAAEHDLIVTGSSDYHGSGKPNELGENLTSEQSLRRNRAEAGSGTQVVRP